MPTSMFQYEMLPTTWFFVSSLLIVAVFFRFNRFWSVRNLDIMALVLSTPALLYIAMAQNASDPLNETGYVWLAFFGCFMFVRLLLDTFMVRRPLLEPNLSSSALTFSCVMLMGFMIANVVVNRGSNIESPRTIRIEQILSMRAEYGSDPVARFRDKPGYAPFIRFSELTNRFLAPPKSFWLLHFSNTGVSESFNTGNTGKVTRSNHTIAPSVLRERQKEAAEREDVFESAFLVSLVLLIQTGIVLGIVLIGHCHFGNIKTGVAAAMFYLLLPYVAQVPASLDHIVPALLIVMAVLFYRRPMVSGLFLGTAGSLVFYPFFLLPLWASFYLKRGIVRFGMGTASAVLAMSLLLLLSPSQLGNFGEQVALMFGYHSIRVPVPDGLWANSPTIYRFPIIAVYGGFCFGMLLWPPRKNLATLISGSALLMLGVQFWMGNFGGLYMAWYLPMLILTVFRPNLEDRVATSTVIEI